MMGNDLIDKAKPGPTFDAESMRAILAGRKTQTRRIIKGLDGTYFGVFNDDEPHPWPQYADEGGVWHPWVPTYRVGGVYYARESLERYLDCVIYRTGDPLKVDGKPHQIGWPWKCRVLAPHLMPRWAARVWLRITDVRVQRLGEIDLPDIMAEGVEAEYWAALMDMWVARWEQVNGRGSWERDRMKWVAAYTFETLRGEG